MRTSWKKLGLIAFIMALTFVLPLSCGGDGGDDNSTGNQGDNVIIVDGDGDTVPDNQDCAPNDPLRWQAIIFYPDSDQDALPESNAGTAFCVGNANTYPVGWTRNAPPPFDPCPNDPTNTCGVPGVPYLRIVFAFATVKTTWRMEGNCFPDPDPPDDWPEMCNGTGQTGTCQDEVNPDAIINGSCMFALNFFPGILNACYVNDIGHWLPCQDSLTNLIDGFNGNGMASLEVYLSLDGTPAGEILIAWDVIDNNQGGANYILDLTTGDDGDDTDIITVIRIDSDGDGIVNPDDNCILVANPGQEANVGNPTYIDPYGNTRLVGNVCIGIDDNNNGYPNPL